MVKEKTLPHDWHTDCFRWHGELLTGKYTHWCAEWDYLPIDETCGEFECCLCYDNEMETQATQDEVTKIKKALIEKRIKDDDGNSQDTLR